MIRGKQNIKEWFVMQGRPYFKIYRGATDKINGNPVFSNHDREGEDMESAKSYFEKCLSLISDGEFFMYSSDEEKKGSSRGRSETRFAISMNEVPSNLQQNVQQSINGIGGQYDYETMMQKASEMAEKKFEELQTKAKLKEVQEQLAVLAKENKELTNRINQPWNKVVETITPHIGSIMQSMGIVKPAAMPISGIPHDNHVDEHTEAVATPEMSQDEQQRMNAIVHSFCEALHAQYPDTWLTIIEKLTNTIKTQPSKIDMALTFL